MVKRHKKLTVIVIIGVILATIFGIVRYIDYSNKFSLKDYEMLTKRAEEAINSAGVPDIQDIKKSNYCSYERQWVYSSIQLYCGVELVASLPYQNDDQAKSFAQSLEREISAQFGPLVLGFSEFYKQPRDGHGTAVTNTRKPLPDAQCQFYIYSNSKARYASRAFKGKDDLIVVQFHCNGLSQKEYFPVTYRQG